MNLHFGFFFSTVMRFTLFKVVQRPMNNFSRRDVVVWLEGPRAYSGQFSDRS